MIRIKLNIIISMLCFLMASCFIDNDNGSEDSSNGQVNVTFTVTLPPPTTVETATRVGYSDADIKNVDVLIFDEHSKFLNRIKVDEADLITTGSGVNFSVRLDATPNRRTIHLIANGRTEVGAERINYASAVAGALESAVIPLLHTEDPLHNTSLLADVAPLVMWGRTELNGVNVVNGASIKLLRTVASIQVKTESVTLENGLADLELRQFYLMGAPKQGYLTPDDYQSEASTPTNVRPFPALAVYPTELAVADFGSSIYMYERKCLAPEYQGVILSAVYKGKPCFYKVAIVDGETPLSIVRNHRYTLKVVKVSGVGYADIDTAIASAPSNALKVDLTDEDEDLPCIVADGQYMMGLSNNSFVMYGNSLAGVELGTIYSDRGVKPVLTIPSDVNWLTNLSATSLGNNKYRIMANFTNETKELRSTTLTMVCDNLSQTMQVDWNPSVSDSGDTNSYVVDLFSGLDKNWDARITSGASEGKHIYLHPTASSPGYFTPTMGPGVGMVTGLNSIYASHAYLHLAVGAKGVVKVSTSISGKAISRRIVIDVQ